jgi:hypothetical protein
LAEKYFLQLLNLDPTNAMGRVLYGSALTMKARDAFWPPTRMAYVKAGLKEMDAAVKLAPDNPRVRYARAINNYHMPKFMGREEIVRADFAWLWEQVQAKPETFDTEFKQNVALHQGLVLKKRKQASAAVKVWLQGREFDSQSKIAAEIDEQVAKTPVRSKQ